MASVGRDTSPSALERNSQQLLDGSDAVLGTGSAMIDGISGLEMPQNLIDQLRQKYKTRTYNGYTGWPPVDSVPTVLPDGAALAAPGCSP